MKKIILKNLLDTGSKFYVSLSEFTIGRNGGRTYFCNIAYQSVL